MQEIEEFASKADNDNARLGAHKLRVSMLFKLIDFFHAYNIEELRERVEKLETAAKKRGMT